MQGVLTHDPHQRFETSEAGLAAARALSAHGPYTRADFEKATGLSRTTSRKVFNALLAVHIIVKTGASGSKLILYETNEA
jgi:Fic family protein